MVSRRTGLRDRWRMVVLASPHITDSVRVVLLVLADHITDRGYVSVPRSTIAETISRSPRRVTERLEKARDAGLLAVVRSGQPGRTAEYVAVIPAPHGADGCTKQHGADYSTHSWRTGAPSETDETTATWCARGSNQYARVTNETRQNNGHARDAGVEPDHAVTEEQELREGKNPQATRRAVTAPRAGV